MKNRHRLRREQILSKLAEIEESIDLVKENMPEEFEEYKKLGIVKYGIYKRLEFSIENVINICSIINSDLKLGIPAKEQDVTDNLISEGIISEKMQELIRQMKGFRNIVVHRYGKIDDWITFTIISEHIDDFCEFDSEIRRFLRVG
ncbi:MAG: DUF86 domain-containing protein, partial [Euryarchaeota archaeon]|nr:DUF86 domain-containing protein [Euryarchaeota archaeon]